MKEYILSDASREEFEPEEKVQAPEPFHLIISHELYAAIRNNQGLAHANNNLIDKDFAQEFEQFKNSFKTFLDLLNKKDNSAFSVLSNIMNMWGYGRRYCGQCGKPIIGKSGHIENRLVCNSCNESYRITNELYKRDTSPYRAAKKKFDYNKTQPAKTTNKSENAAPTAKNNA
jgi:NADH pyrophosphatase NudC (nudix superfamily)